MCKANGEHVTEWRKHLFEKLTVAQLLTGLSSQRLGFDSRTIIFPKSGQFWECFYLLVLARTIPLRFLTATQIPGLELTAVAVVHFVHKIAPSVLLRQLQTGDVITWLQARNEESSECRRTRQSDTKNMYCTKRKEIWRASGIWSLKFYDPDDLEKQQKLSVRLNGTYWKESDIESLNEGTSWGAA